MSNSRGCSFIINAPCAGDLLVAGSMAIAAGAVTLSVRAAGAA